MKKLLILLLFVPFLGQSQGLHKIFKYSTFYAAVNGGTSLGDDQIWSVTSGFLEEQVIKTPFDYNVSVGIRKIKRFGYENRANTFYNGTENSYSDAATIGRVDGFEYLFEADFVRRLGVNYTNQHHFVRYVADNWVAKVEYLEDGFADIKYFEASQRYRKKVREGKLSFNGGLVQRLAEPYGFDPLADWVLDNGTLHYTYLALQEGYSISLDGEYFSPEGDLVANSQAVWEEVVIPQVINNYVEKQRNSISNIVEYSFVLGLDYYHFTKDFWFHTWGNIMPYHLNTNNVYSYHNFNNGQWMDYSMGLIYGYRFNKSFGIFVEGKYNKYWNRRWHNFSVGLNYVIF
jgi:hypothetical protein|tara:strand:+ start:439 stop:1473 length:1035 start_codon:yes stop_codon:yes gene_type:complete